MQVALDISRQGIEPARRRAGLKRRLERRRERRVVQNLADEGFRRGGLQHGQDGRGRQCAFELAGGLAELEEGGWVCGEGGNADEGGAWGG